MKWADLLGPLDGEVVFRSSLLLSTNESPSTLRAQLGRWTRSGRLLQLRRGVYAVAKPYRSREPHPFAVALALRPASYVSLQSALSYHGLIPEHVAAVTSVTAGRPEKPETPLGRYLFRHLSRARFSGYRAQKLPSGETYLIALPEKALLDLVLLTPGADRRVFLKELRLQNVESLDRDLMGRLAIGAGSPKLVRAVSAIVRLLKEAAP